MTILAFDCAISGLAVWHLKPSPAPPPQPVTRTVITLPPGDQLAAMDNPAIGISPDGSKLAYVAIHAGTRQIYLRALDDLAANPLAGRSRDSAFQLGLDAILRGLHAVADQAARTRAPRERGRARR